MAWLSKKQSSIPLSTTKVEYIAVPTCFTKILWMKKTLQDVHVQYNDLITIICDNTSAISISKNPVMHYKSKYIPIKYYIVRDHVLEKIIKL